MTHNADTRHALAPLLGQRRSFEAVFNHRGTRVQDGEIINTICLHDVRLDTDPVADHVWIDSSLTWLHYDLQPGDVVYFEATAHRYAWNRYGLCDAVPVWVLER